jgi:hypothetical protein
MDNSFLKKKGTISNILQKQGRMKNRIRPRKDIEKLRAVDLSTRKKNNVRVLHKKSMI